MCNVLFYFSPRVDSTLHQQVLQLGSSFTQEQGRNIRECFQVHKRDMGKSTVFKCIFKIIICQMSLSILYRAFFVRFFNMTFV